MRILKIEKLEEIKSYFKLMDDEYENFVQEYFKFESKPTKGNREKVIMKTKIFRYTFNKLNQKLKDLYIPEKEK